MNLGATFGRLWATVGPLFLLLFSAVFFTSLFGYLLAGVLFRLGTFWASFCEGFSAQARPKRFLRDPTFSPRKMRKNKGNEGKFVGKILDDIGKIFSGLAICGKIYENLGKN